MKKLFSSLGNKKIIKPLTGKAKPLDKVIPKEIIHDYNLIEKIKTEIENNLETKGTLADKLFVKIFEKTKTELSQSYSKFVRHINELTEYGSSIQPEDSRLELERKEFASKYLRMKQCLMLNA